MRKLFEEVRDNSKAIIKMNVFLVKNSKRKVPSSDIIYTLLLKTTDYKITQTEVE